MEHSLSQIGGGKQTVDLDRGQGHIDLEPGSADSGDLEVDLPSLFTAVSQHAGCGSSIEQACSKRR